MIWTLLADTGSNLAMIVRDPDKFPSPVTEKWTLFVCSIGSRVSNALSLRLSGFSKRL